MPLTGITLLAALLAAGSTDDRVLLCRPVVEGDPALARAEAIGEAARTLAGRFLDYRVTCESPGEAARAAQRAGLAHALRTTAEGRVQGSRFVLVLLTSAEEEALAERVVEVPPGDPAEERVRAALLELHDRVPRPPPRWPTVTGWTLGVIGVAALVAGAVVAKQARTEAQRADDATTPGDYLAAEEAWRAKRTTSAVAFAAGATALAAGVTVALAF